MICGPLDLWNLKALASMRLDMDKLCHKCRRLPPLLHITGRALPRAKPLTQIPQYLGPSVNTVDSRPDRGLDRDSRPMALPELNGVDHRLRQRCTYLGHLRWTSPLCQYRPRVHALHLALGRLSFASDWPNQTSRGWRVFPIRGARLRPYQRHRLAKI